MYGVPLPCMGGSSHTAHLNRVESRAFRLINSPNLTDSLQSLSSRRKVASLSLYYRYFHNYCSSELFESMPPLMRRPRPTRHSTYSHPYSVQLPFHRLSLCQSMFMHRTGEAWNLLPTTIFPSFFNLQTFKECVSAHVGH